jgi:excisionase family DNA binding protein
MNSDKKLQNTLFNNLEWMDSKETAEYLRISIGSLRNLVYRGKLPAKKLGNRLRFRKLELDLFINNSALEN